MDIFEENLHCHHFLFIQDVIGSTFDISKDCFRTSQTYLSYRRARLNGIVVAQETPSNQNERHFWLDDGTGVIRAIFSQEIMKRIDGYSIDIATCLSVFGIIQTYKGKEIAIHCGGFKIEDDCLSEVRYWIKALQDRPRQDKLGRNESKNMFYSLSSLPSPKRLLTPNFMESPLRKTPNSQNPNTYIWSPDHAFATSTPMRVVQDLSQRRSQLTASSTKTDSQPKLLQHFEDDDFDDEFGSFGDVDLLALEQQAYSSSKRKWDQSME